MADAPTVFAFGGFEVDEALQELRREGRPVELHATPLRLLLYLLRNRDRVVPKEELLDRVWPEAVVSEDALFSALKEIRQALGESGSKEHTVETLRGRGYRLSVPVEERPAGARPGRAGAPEGAIRSIAVLPLENLSGDPEQEYFADGMTEALIGDLAKIGELRVISRTSVMHYKGQRKPLPEIARELNVDGAIEGTVMRAGDRVRISAQLIDARSDSHLWSDRYDRELSDVLALQSDVARAVTEQIRLKLTPEEQAALAGSRTVDPRAYDAYLRGLKLRGPIDVVGHWGPSAIEQFERAVELDPDFAEGWSALAFARVCLGLDGFDLRLRGEFPKAREAAQRALEIDDRLGEAHAHLGLVRLYYDWDFTGARRAFERAVQLGPSDPTALNDYAWYLLRVEGRTEEALDFSERLLRVAPLDVFFRGERFRHFYTARQYERALEEVERIRELEPGFVEVAIADTYAALGRSEEAHRAYIAFCERGGAGWDRHREAFERGWAEGGPVAAIRALLDLMTNIEGYSPFVIAVNHARIWETDEAFTWLERGYRERDPLMIILKAEPSFDLLRFDPRFDDLLHRIGFPGSTAADIEESKEGQEAYLFVHEAEPAFTIPIPVEFRREAATGTNVFYARAGGSALTIGVIKMGEVPDLSQLAPGYAAFLMHEGDGRAELIREVRTELTDGTPAVEFAVKWFNRQHLAVSTQALALLKGGYSIAIGVHTFGGQVPDKKILYGFDFGPVLSENGEEPADLVSR